VAGWEGAPGFPAGDFCKHIQRQAMRETASNSLDTTVICDSTNAYLFYAYDDGTIHRASMPIGSFPGTFTNSSIIMSDTNAANLFESPEVYTVTTQASLPLTLPIHRFQ
jgi:hypothetical protein